MGNVVGEKSGSAPWIYWQGKLYVGKVRESHYHLIRREMPEDFETLALLDADGAVTGRVWMDWGEAASYSVYSSNEVDKETLVKLSKEFGVREPD